MSEEEKQDEGQAGRAFVWLAQSGRARNGRCLKRGAIHAAENFPARVVTEWIKTGAAKWATVADIENLPAAGPDGSAGRYREALSPEEVKNSAGLYLLVYYHNGAQESVQGGLFEAAKGSDLLQKRLERAGYSASVLNTALGESALARIFDYREKPHLISLIERLQDSFNEIFEAGDSREARLKWFWFINVLSEKINQYRIESAAAAVRKALLLTALGELDALFFERPPKGYGSALPAGYFKSKGHALIRLPRPVDSFIRGVLPAGRLTAATRKIEAEDRGPVYVWKASGPDGIQAEFRFDKDLLIDSKGKERLPSPAGMNADIRAIIRLLFAKKQNPLVYTDRERLNALGIKDPSGDDYEQARTNHRALAGFRKIEKDETGRIIGIKSSPYREVRLSDPKRGNPWNVAHFDDEILAGVDRKTFRLEGGAFKTLPAGRKYRGMKQRAFEYLTMNVSGRSLTVNGDTLLAALGATKDALRSKRKALFIMDDFFQTARAEGFDYEINSRGSGKEYLVDMLQKHTLAKIEREFQPKDEKGERIKLQDPAFLGDCEKWQIIIYSPSKLRRLTAEESELVAAIIKWGYKGKEDFGQITPADVAKRQIAGVVKALGGPAVSAIWRAIMGGPRFIEGENGESINQWAALWAGLKKARREKFAK
jgi:hypothetical protein